VSRPGFALHMLFVRIRLSNSESPFLRRHCAFLAGFLIFSFGACSAGAPSTGVPPAATVPTVVYASPTPTTLPAGTVLYQADWSHGLAGWQGVQGWKVVQRQLETNSSGPLTLTIPYRPTVNNYAVEVRFQIVRLLQQNGGYFTIFASKAPGKDGYQAGVLNLEGSEPRPNGAHPQAQVFIDPASSMASGSSLPIDYEPGFKWHTYRVEVQDNEARLLDNGVQIGRASSEQTDVLSNGPIGLSSDLVVLRISNICIMAL
jgi:hypothetical protein